MNKKLLILIGIIIFAGLVVFAIFNSFSRPVPAQSSTPFPPHTGSPHIEPSLIITSPPAPSSTANTTGPVIFIRTSDGRSLQINDFKQDPELVADPINGGHYSLGYNLYSDPTKKVPYMIE